MKTKLKKKLDALSEKDLKALAKKLDTSAEYLAGHIYYSRRVPKRPFMSELQKELGLKDIDMYRHFYTSTQAAKPDQAA